MRARRVGPVARDRRFWLSGRWPIRATAGHVRNRVGSQLADVRTRRSRPIARPPRPRGAAHRKNERRFRSGAQEERTAVSLCGEGRSPSQAGGVRGCWQPGRSSEGSPTRRTGRTNGGFAAHRANARQSARRRPSRQAAEPHFVIRFRSDSQRVDVSDGCVQKAMTDSTALTDSTAEVDAGDYRTARIPRAPCLALAVAEGRARLSAVAGSGLPLA